jgi:hypothetical protein
MKIEDVQKFRELLNKCILKPNLETCVVGRSLNKKTDKLDWYYEFTIISGPFSETKTKYQRTYFRSLEDHEVINDIFNTITKPSLPFVFDFKKARFTKVLEMFG